MSLARAKDAWDWERKFQPELEPWAVEYHDSSSIQVKRKGFLPIEGFTDTTCVWLSYSEVCQIRLAMDENPDLTDVMIDIVGWYDD